MQKVDILFVNYCEISSLKCGRYHPHHHHHHHHQYQHRKDHIKNLGACGLTHNTVYNCFLQKLVTDFCKLQNIKFYLNRA